MGNISTSMTKTIIAVIMFVECFFFSSVAFFPIHKNFKNSENIISLMNCFTSGLFFAMGFNHIFKESNEKFFELEGIKSTGVRNWNENYKALIQKDLDSGDSHFHVHIFWISFFLIFSIDNVFLGHHNQQEEHHHHHDHHSPLKLPEETEKILENLIPQEDKEDFELVEHRHKHHEKGVFLLLLALSIHAFVTGIAIGLQTEMAVILNISIGKFSFLPIIGSSMHKWAEALALGFNLIKAQFRTINIVIILIFFGLVTPIGIFTGWVFNHLKFKLRQIVGGYDDKIDVILMSISASTFFYMSVVEILSDELSKRDNIFWKFLFFLFGYVVIVLLTKFFDKD